MHPIHFKQVNITLAENQPEYQPLPVQYNDEVPDGPMTSFWKLDEAELAQINKTGGLFIKQLTFHKPFQPIQPSVYNPFEVVELGYYKVPNGGFMALIPLQDNTYDHVHGLTFGLLLDNLSAKYVGYNPENWCFVKVAPPDKPGNIPA